MFGKRKKSADRRLKASLQKAKKAVDLERASEISFRTIVALKTRQALDKLGVEDKAKRRLIHKSMQRLFGRTIILQRWGKMPSDNWSIAADLLRKGTDPFMAEHFDELKDVLGKKTFDKFMLYFFLFKPKLKPKKN